MEFPIRAERAEDCEAISRLIAEAFGRSEEAKLVAALRTAGNLSVSLLAEDAEGRPVGHIAFSPLTLDGAPCPGLGLAPLAVAEGFRRRGIGGALVESGLAGCRRAGAKFAVVLGEPEYYGRFGFRAASGWGLGNEYQVDEPFQAVELEPGGMPRGGLVRYAPEFGQLGD